MSQSEFYRGLEAATAALARAGDAAAGQAAAVHDALQPSLGGRRDGPTVACDVGCAHCCHFPVGVRFGEAQHLAAAVRSQPDLLSAVRREAAVTAGSTWSELVGRACPLLRDGTCSVYESRPLPCRAMASTDAEACAGALRNGPPPPIDGEAFWRGLGAASALDARRPNVSARELRSALAALLATAPEATEAACEAAFTASRELPR
ncbi:MAG: hypothetical protein RL398_813 [Planctomycetota bacterium]